MMEVSRVWTHQYSAHCAAVGVKLPRALDGLLLLLKAMRPNPSIGSATPWKPFASVRLSFALGLLP